MLPAMAATCSGCHPSTRCTPANPGRERSATCATAAHSGDCSASWRPEVGPSGVSESQPRCGGGGAPLPYPHLHAAAARHLVQRRGPALVRRQRARQPLDERHLVLHGCQVYGRAVEHVLGEQEARAAARKQRVHHAAVPAHHRVVQGRAPHAVSGRSIRALHHHKQQEEQQ